MALEKKIEVDLVEVKGTMIQVRTKTSTIEDGVEIGATFHRHVLAPGECDESQADNVKAICAAVHTPEVVQAYRAEQARIRAEKEASDAKAAAEAEAARIQAEQQAAAAEAERKAAEQAAFDAAVAAAVRKALTGA